ncbi:SanA protein [Tenacibaculum sp. MAR_2009_124]|uniref:SanA/YdcF family protein n=1 Tax=Tenacibaculum sp. MAR_2009_124 TaxID=1250059 RepID=UPI0008964D67|nr:ElyC/SanA/YdcF family protein [Tenacibaculum sp. MAR_2009_124]SEC91356.1 SanA protein [Tenacibaculum sp. MAR_2009_124]
MKKKSKKVLRFAVSLILAILIVVVLCNSLIYSNAKAKTYSNIDLVPKKKVGLLLGTNKFLKNGNINLYYKYRVEAAVNLFRKGKLKYIIVSGDNGAKGYDEPTQFKEDLIKRGVPANRIFLDYAGFRTLDSVVRAKEVFDQDDILIVSQKFHNERAIYLAEHKGLVAAGYNAKDVHGRLGMKVKIREYLARVKVFVDIVFRVKPKYLGEKIEIK